MNGNLSRLSHEDRYLSLGLLLVVCVRRERGDGKFPKTSALGGFCHLYIGQEAILAGMITAIRPTDRIITGYRDHAHPLVLGTPSKNVMAELFGKITGTSKGKGGSMPYFDKERNLFGGHGSVGGQIGLVELIFRPIAGLDGKHGGLRQQPHLALIHI